MARILIIEDNTDIRENMVEILELEGYEVITAHNGQAGLAVARTEVPDLILCDVMMPVMDGHEVLKALHEHDPGSKIPFVFVTANAEKKEMIAGLEMGAHGYIRKPFEIHELLAEVARCLLQRSGA